MATPNLAPEEINELSGMIAQYIMGQRGRFAAAATPLSAGQRDALAEFFTPQVLDGTRILELRGERVANPDFYPALQGMGFNNLPDMSTMLAITFSDIVVAHQPFTVDLLFHELVHAEQYRQLGVERFSDLYIRGFLNGGGYYGIPLEINAYMLGEKYERAPTEHFSVAEEVSRWIAENRF